MQITLRRLALEFGVDIRSLPGLSWEGLPPSDSFNEYQFHAEIDRYLRHEPQDHWADLCEKGCFMVAGARIDECGDWRFAVRLAHDKKWRDRTVENLKLLGYSWVAALQDLGCPGVQDPESYMRGRLQALTGELQAAIAAG